MVDMFCGLGLGCLIWTAVDALKDKQFSKPLVIIMTIVQTFLMPFIPFRTLAPTNIPINPFSFSWPTLFANSLGLFVLIVVVITFAMSILAERLNKKLQAWLDTEP